MSVAVVHKVSADAPDRLPADKLPADRLPVDDSDILALAVDDSDILAVGFAHAHPRHWQMLALPGDFPVLERL